MEFLLIRDFGAYGTGVRKMYAVWSGELLVGYVELVIKNDTFTDLLSLTIIKSLRRQGYGLKVMALLPPTINICNIQKSAVGFWKKYQQRKDA
jgi:hypothetical protein